MSLNSRYRREYAYAGTRQIPFDNQNRRRWGGSEPQAPVYNITQPATPAAPTATQTAEDYAKALPIYYNAALEYNPLLAASEKSTNELLYPNTAGLQEIVAGQAKTGLTEDLPSWYQSKVADTLSAKLGRNLVYNPQAQEQYGLNTQSAFKDYGDYWRNLALSAAGRQPLATSPNLANTYTPAAQMQNSAQNYGNYSNAYSSMYGANQSANASMYGSYQNAQAQRYSANMNMIGQIGGGAMSGLGAMMV